MMKLLPKWEKGKTWQSMFPDKVLAPLRARAMDRWICRRRREEGMAGVTAGVGSALGMGPGTRNELEWGIGEVSDGIRVGGRTEFRYGDGVGMDISSGWGRGMSWGRTGLKLGARRGGVEDGISGTDRVRFGVRMGLTLKLRLGVEVSLEAKPGSWGLGGPGNPTSPCLAGPSAAAGAGAARGQDGPCSGHLPSSPAGSILWPA